MCKFYMLRFIITITVLATILLVYGCQGLEPQPI